MVAVVASAPTRVDLAGGTVDLWPIHNLLRQKATVNFGLSIRTHTHVEPHSRYVLESEDLGLRFEGAFEDALKWDQVPLFGLMLESLWDPRLGPVKIRTRSESPKGAGIGGSSSLALTLASALAGLRRLMDSEKNGTQSVDRLQLYRAEEGIERPHPEKLIRFVQDLESALIKIPTGVQDYWGALYGGFNVLRFPFGHVERVEAPRVFTEVFTNRFVVIYSGVSRASAKNNWEIFRRFFEQDASVTMTLEAIGAYAAKAAEAALKGDYKGLILNSELEWQARTMLWPEVETEQTIKIAEAMRKEGADLVRVCGAGGGGVMVAIGAESKKERIKEAAIAAGGTHLQATLDHQGLLIKRL